LGGGAKGVGAEKLSRVSMAPTKEGIRHYRDAKRIRRTLLMDFVSMLMSAPMESLTPAISGLGRDVFG